MKNASLLKHTWKDTKVNNETLEFSVEIELQGDQNMMVFGNLNLKDPTEYVVEIKKLGNGGGTYNDINFSDKADSIKRIIKSSLKDSALVSAMIFERIDGQLKQNFKIPGLSDFENYRKFQTVNDFFINKSEIDKIWTESRNFNKTAMTFLEMNKNYKNMLIFNEMLWKDQKFINNKIETMVLYNFEASAIRTFFGMSVESFIKGDLTMTARTSALDDSNIRDLVGCLVPVNVFEKMNPKYIFPLLNVMAARISKNFVDQQNAYKDGMFYASESLDVNSITTSERAYSDFVVGINFADIGTFKITRISPSIYSEPKSVAREYMIATAPLNNEKLRMIDCTLLCNVEINGYEALDNKRSIERARMILKPAA